MAFVILHRLLLFSKAATKGAARKTCAFQLKDEQDLLQGKANQNVSAPVYLLLHYCTVKCFL